jgi:hypothetical protein
MYYSPPYESWLFMAMVALALLWCHLAIYGYDGFGLGFHGYGLAMAPLG